MLWRHSGQEARQEQPHTTWALEPTPFLCMGKETRYLGCMGPAEKVSHGSSGDFGVKPSDDIVKMGVAPWCSQETLTSTAQRADLSGDTIRGIGGHSKTCRQNKQTNKNNSMGYKCTVDLIKTEAGGPWK